MQRITDIYRSAVKIVSRLGLGADGSAEALCTLRAISREIAQRPHDGPGRLDRDLSLRGHSWFTELWRSLGSTELGRVQDVEVKTTIGDEMSEAIYGCLRLKGPLLTPVTLDPGSEDSLKMRQRIFRFTPDAAAESVKGNLFGTTCFYRSPDVITGKPIDMLEVSFETYRPEGGAVPARGILPLFFQYE